MEVGEGQEEFDGEGKAGREGGLGGGEEEEPQRTRIHKTSAGGQEFEREKGGGEAQKKKPKIKIIYK